MWRDFFKKGQAAMPPFVEKVEDHKGLQIVWLKGPIDMSTIPDTEQFVGWAKKKSGLLDKNLMLDFKKVTHVDSSTIAVLLKALSELTHKNYKLVLVNITPKLKSMLDILKFDNVFSICRSDEKTCQDLRDRLKG